MQKFSRHLLAVAVSGACAVASASAFAGSYFGFDLEWRHYASASQPGDQLDVFDESAAEIVAHDPDSQRVFVVNGDQDRIDVLDAATGNHLGFLAVDGGPNSVAVKHGIVAVAVEDSGSAQAPGRIMFFDADEGDLSGANVSTGEVVVGALPDMVTFTPDGTKVLVANEGEPAGYGAGGNDPEGSVSIIDISDGVGSVGAGDVTTAVFTGFNKTDLTNAGVRITGPGVGGATESTAAQDIEPEYISVGPNGDKAYVTLQENNAIAVVDIATGNVEAIHALALKDHGAGGNGLDASDRDGSGPAGINIQTWDNVKGMPMPDSIGSYQAAGRTYVVTANEGDGREYDILDDTGATIDTYEDETRFKDLPVGGMVTAALQEDDQLGRLTVSSVDIDGSTPTTYDEVMSFGTRSFSIWDGETGDLVYDSGDLFEQITAGLALVDQDGNPVFNSDNADYDDDETPPDQTHRSFDGRSDNKGPEPEALVLGQVLDRTLAFIGLERVGGIMAFDITDPASPVFLDYLLDRNFLVDASTVEALDIGPEGFAFVTPEDSPFGTYGLIVGNEVSGTTTWYSIHVPVPAPAALFGAGLPLMLLARRRR